MVWSSCALCGQECRRGDSPIPKDLFDVRKPPPRAAAAAALATAPAEATRLHSGPSPDPPCLRTVRTEVDEINEKKTRAATKDYQPAPKRELKPRQPELAALAGDVPLEALLPQEGEALTAQMSLRPRVKLENTAGVPASRAMRDMRSRNKVEAIRSDF